DGLRIAPLLAGARGRPACDRASLARLLDGLGRLITALPEIAEIDLNPVFALPDGAAIADVRIILHRSDQDRDDANRRGPWRQQCPRRLLPISPARGPG